MSIKLNVVGLLSLAFACSLVVAQESESSQKSWVRLINQHKILTDNNLKKKLNLSKKQELAVNDLSKQFTTLIRLRIKSLSGQLNDQENSKYENQLKELASSFEKLMAEELNEKQRKQVVQFVAGRLHDINNLTAGLLRADLAELLETSQGQRSAIQLIGESFKQKIDKLQKGTDLQLAELDLATVKKILAELDGKQKIKLKKIVGDIEGEYKLKINRLKNNK